MKPSTKPTKGRGDSISYPIKQRSRVTNGRRSFVTGNGNSPWARRWRDLVELHAAEMSLAGPDHLTEAQRSLIRRLATLEIELEQMEGRLSEPCIPRQRPFCCRTTSI